MMNAFNGTLNLMKSLMQTTKLQISGNDWKSPVHIATQLGISQQNYRIVI